MKDSSLEIETVRLLLRQWRQSDFEVYAAFYENQAISRLVGGPMSREKAWRHLAMTLGHWQLRGFGMWAVEEKSTSELIGSIGLWKPEGWPELAIGYWLLEAARGKGYATEGAKGARDYAFDELGATTLVSYIEPSNVDSIRVAERMGAWHDETIQLLNDREHCVYRHSNPTGSLQHKR